MLKDKNVSNKQDLDAFTKKMNQKRIIGHHMGNKPNEDLYAEIDDTQLNEDEGKLQE